MPRRYRPEKREIKPDLRYDSVTVQMFVNRMMYGGKKSTAQRIIYDAFDLIEKRLKRSPLEVFEQAMQNVTPRIEVKPRRVATGALALAYLHLGVWAALPIRSRWRFPSTDVPRWLSGGCWPPPGIVAAGQWLKNCRPN